MSHTNPLWLGALSVFLGALLWMAPSCWFAEKPRPSREPEAPRRTRTYASIGWSPLRSLPGVR